MNDLPHRVEKTCEQCSAVFSVKFSHRNQRFCAFPCKKEHERIHGRVAAQAPLTEFSCRECSKPFFYKPAYLKEYRKKFNKDPMYCSRPCSAIGRRKDSEERNKFICKNCGNETYRTRRPSGGNLYYGQELCSKQCKNEWVSKVYRAKHGLPEITKRVKRGYVILRIPAQNGSPVRHVLEHRYVVEQRLGRKLYPEETVHHVNGDRQDNSDANLELFSSRHGPGQRVIDKVQFAIEILTLYPDFGRTAGYELRKV